jgi:hypothetical protein
LDHEEFQEFVDEFFYQGNLRGRNLHAVNFNFIIRFGETDDRGFAGQCKYRNNIITIRPETWERIDYYEKEWLVFHELGHCILNREHRNEESGTSECLSIMHGDENNFNCSTNLYSNYWREYYLDELFDEATPLPDWHARNQDYANSILDYTDSLVIYDTMVERFKIDTFEFETKKKFLFEIHFFNWNTQQNSVYLALGDLLFLHCRTCVPFKTAIDLRGSRFYREGGLAFNSDTKLSILRNGDIVSLYGRRSSRSSKKPVRTV